MVLIRKTNINLEEMIKESRKIMPPDISSNEVVNIFKDFFSMQQLYNSAIREITTKLEILDDEFQMLYSHNPIHYIECRLKSIKSIAEKLVKRGFPLSIESAAKNITDIAGVRVVCHYINDVYTIADLLSKQNDIKIIKISDYIKEPKKNGYRSLHLIVTAPVYLSQKAERVPVEIQLRTIAMDFWASLEHQLKYKSSSEMKDDLQIQLKACAEEISCVDLKMQAIHEKIKLEKNND